jgi:choline dehydrogenase
MARKLSQTAPLKNSLGEEIVPGPNVVTDEEIDSWLARTASTEFHPTATCAMLPESQGGVVNAKLQVYGIGECQVAGALNHRLTDLPSQLMFVLLIPRCFR